MQNFDRHYFLNQVLPNNPGKIILKFGASWCKPCQKIDPVVCKLFENTPSTIETYIIDVDTYFDLYAFFKKNKRISTIPAFFIYNKGNNTYLPDDCLSDSNPDVVVPFLKKHLGIE